MIFIGAKDNQEKKLVVVLIFVSEQYSLFIHFVFLVDGACLCL